MPAQRTARILVVDDDESVRMLLARALRLEGYEVVAVGCGAGGIYAAQAAAPYDLVVTNWHVDPLRGEHIEQMWAGGSGAPLLHLDELSWRDLAELPNDRPTLYQPFSMDALLRRVEERLAKGDG